MKDRLKRFFLSMFSDRYVAESTEYGIGNLLLTSALAAVFLFVGAFVGRYCLIGADLRFAPQFREFAYAAFDNGGISVRADGTGAAEIELNGQAVTVNTYVNPSDKDKFASNGYGLIVDPAPSAAFDDFTAYCVNGNDGTRIAYETYRALSDAEKKSYSFAVDYSGSVKTIDEKQADGYLAFLKTVDGAKSELAEIEENKGSASVVEYRDSLWELYVKYYYPDIKKATGEQTPTLGGYYYAFVTGSDKYLCIFGDMTTVAFVTDVGKRVTIGFYYDDGANIDAAAFSTRAALEKGVNAFFENGYFGGMSARIFSDFGDWIITVLLAELVVALTIALCYVVCRKLNISQYKTFSDSAKAVGSFAHIAAFMSAAVALLSGFLFGGMTVSLVGAAAYLIAMTARTAVLLVCTYKKEKKEYDEAERDCAV